MPPVPVFIDEPITPKKPQGITPQTAGSSSGDVANTPSTTTAQAPYPAARPGQGVPAPTPYAPTPQALPQPTRTTTTAANDNAPPPPQPGAVPVAPSQQQAAPTTTIPLPPPPMAGQSTTTMPPQMSIPPPQQNYAPVYGTSSAPTTTTPQRPGPTTLNFGAAPAPQTQAGSHPPGYQQNVMAQEMSSAARASLDQQEEQRRPSMVPNLNLGGDSANDTAGNVWNAVKGWASAAGNTLAETEKEVWKRINRDS